eukprot:7392114-Prorocentrum_lima.AAC.1
MKRDAPKEREGDATPNGKDGRDGRTIPPKAKKSATNAKRTGERTPGREQPGTVQASQTPTPQ